MIILHKPIELGIHRAQRTENEGQGRTPLSTPWAHGIQPVFSQDDLRNVTCDLGECQSIYKILVKLKLNDVIKNKYRTFYIFLLAKCLEITVLNVTAGVAVCLSS